MNDEYDLAGALFEPATGLLRGANGMSKLEPKAAGVLALLCREQGRLVTRQRLLDECWGTGEGSDEALTQAIAQIRRALENIGATDSISTYPKRGYRLSQSPTASKKVDRRARRIPIWVPLSVALAACFFILAIAPGYPRHAIRHALGLGPPHAQHRFFGNQGSR